LNATTPTPEPGASLAERIADAQASIASLVATKTAEISFKKPDGSYGKFSYSYLDKSTLMAHARQELAGRGVAVLPSQVSITQEKNRTAVTMRVTLLHGSESFSVERTGYGHADDDKGPSKAGTTAVRLALADLLLQGGDEPSGDFQEADFREHQNLDPGDRPATPEQLKYAGDLVMRAQLDKAMPDAGSAVLRLARPIAQSEIGPGLEVPDALRLIPQPVMSKLIERLEKYAENPKGAKVVWDKVAEWEGANGYANSVNPEDTKIEAPAPVDPDEEIPF
jgi:hypothetical protein